MEKEEPVEHGEGDAEVDRVEDRAHRVHEELVGVRVVGHLRRWCGACVSECGQVADDERGDTPGSTSEMV